jgi:hypothetical protein
VTVPRESGDVFVPRLAARADVPTASLVYAGWTDTPTSSSRRDLRGDLSTVVLRGEHVELAFPTTPFRCPDHNGPKPPRLLARPLTH